MPVAATGSRTGRSGATTPAYRRIQSEILQRIENGDLKMGDSVASERMLAKAHGVSLMTARQALVGLEREGLVERRRGAGTFVAPPKIHFNKLMSFTEQLTGRSLNPTSKVLSHKVVADEPEVAARLSLPFNAPLIKLERLRLGSGEPFAIETCYLAAESFPELTRAALERGSLFSLLEREYGVEIAHADEEVDATVADAYLARVLAVNPGHPLLRIRQTIFSGRGTPTVCVLGLYRADRHVLRIRRYR
ncbi:MAG: GntR family transcriptional regulator [Terriglobia bacterium]|jgi:GntR family transcriptional regulator|nr:GntR family transcriptional regulator [Terriglobia bacterium]